MFELGKGEGKRKEAPAEQTTRGALASASLLTLATKSKPSPEGKPVRRSNAAPEAEYPGPPQGGARMARSPSLSPPPSLPSTKLVLPLPLLVCGWFRRDVRVAKTS